jgi:flavin reductase (DIM6/NTAB) family NADH-FMN oxidoreductase RutF
MKKFPLNQVYHLIEPGPVVMVSTADRGRANLMTMSWHMMLEFDPPKIMCSLGPWDYSYAALRRTKECVIAIPGADLMKKTVAIGNCSGADIDKFAAFRLTALPAKQVAPPLVGECLYNLECRVSDASLAKTRNLFVVDVVAAWANPARREKRIFHANGDGTFSLEGRQVNLKPLMTRWQDMP